MRKKLLIKPKLQLTHLFLTLGLILVSCLIGYTLMESFITGSLSPEFLQSGEWMSLRGQLRSGFALTSLVLMVIIGFENYFYFHRIVGPIYALEKGFRRLAEGDFNYEVRLRETDEFKDLVQNFKDVKNQLSLRIELSEKMANLLAHELDKVLSDTSLGNIQSLKKRLEELKQEVVKKAA